MRGRKWENSIQNPLMPTFRGTIELAKNTGNKRMVWQASRLKKAINAAEISQPNAGEYLTGLNIMRPLRRLVRWLAQEAREPEKAGHSGIHHTEGWGLGGQARPQVLAGQAVWFNRRGPGSVRDPASKKKKKQMR